MTCVISAKGIFLLFFAQDSRKRTLPMTVKPSVIGGMGGRNTETINDRKQLSACIRRRGIDAMFCGELPHFFLRHYSPGELLTNPFSPSEYLQIIVEGTVLLYDMPDEESTVILQTTNNEVEILGDLELLDAKFTPFFVEAKTEVYTLAVHLEQYRQQLLSDPVFLRALCRNLANKLNGAVAANRHCSLRQRVVMSLRQAEPGTRICNVGQLAQSLNVSARQLMRILKALCGEGVLRHEEKGVYVLLKKPELPRSNLRREESR